MLGALVFSNIGYAKRFKSTKMVKICAHRDYLLDDSDTELAIVLQTNNEICVQYRVKIYVLQCLVHSAYSPQMDERQVQAAINTTQQTN